MTKLASAERLANDLIQVEQIPTLVKDRLQKVVLDLMQKNPCIDVHVHLFDKNCISAIYFMARFAKDFINVRGVRGESEDHFIDILYQNINDNPSNWDIKLAEILAAKEKRGGKRGIVFKLLRMSKMKQIYEYYLKDASLAKYFSKPDEEVLTTALMMDFKYGWKQPKIKKSFYSQILEMQALAKEKPILPFLFCDPRRFEDPEKNENLYALFNKAFTDDIPFFGVKMYPALGYRPSDYRLDPIFNICNDLRIPVLTHCGGESISTDGKELVVFEGSKEITLPERKREDMAYELNDPKHWAPVLKKYPNLVLNLAHFGSDDTWSSADKVPTKIDPQHRKERIFDFIKKYDNVYADFSYTIANESATDHFITVLKNDARIRSRSLFGSDYWVVNQEGSLKDNQTTFLDRVKRGDPALVDVLCKENPRRYLFGELDF